MHLLSLDTLTEDNHGQKMSITEEKKTSQKSEDAKEESKKTD